MLPKSVYFFQNHRISVFLSHVSVFICFLSVYFFSQSKLKHRNCNKKSCLWPIEIQVFQKIAPAAHRNLEVITIFWLRRLTAGFRKIHFLIPPPCRGQKWSFMASKMKIIFFCNRGRSRVIFTAKVYFVKNSDNAY